MNKWLTVCLAVFACLGAQGQLLKIDINNTARSDSTAPGYTPWNLAPDISSSGAEILSGESWTPVTS